MKQIERIILTEDGEIPLETSQLFRILGEEMTELKDALINNNYFSRHKGVDEKIIPYINEYASFLYDGVFTLVWAKALTGKKDVKEIRPLALALGYLWVTGLIYDDISDNRKTRDGKRAFHDLHGLPAAVWYGDLIIAYCYLFLDELFVTIKAKKARSMISEFTKISARAVISLIDELDLQHFSATQAENQQLPSVDKIIEISAGKNLFVYIPRLVGKFYNCSKARVKKLVTIGEKWQAAIQVIGDIRDLNEDIGEAKITLPTLYAFYQTDISERKESIDLFMKEKRTKEDVQKVLCLVKKTGSIEKSSDCVIRLLNETYKLFKTLKLKKTRESLILEKYIQLCYDELTLAVDIAERLVNSEVIEGNL
jgi:heptaprenyl diphosphate synthase